MADLAPDRPRLPPVRVPGDIGRLASRVRDLALKDDGQRVIIGLAGEPGAGKSTMAQQLSADLSAPIVPLDGFHLANAVLAAQGMSTCKGAMETFDIAGFCALIERITVDDATVYAPDFNRDIDEPIAASIPILRSDRIVITEGNYLLAEHPQLRKTRDRLAEVWYLDLASELRTERLIQRHHRFGKSPTAAMQWATGNDERNAAIVRNTRDLADLIIELA